jgi:hypothetical protein
MSVVTPNCGELQLQAAGQTAAKKEKRGITTTSDVFLFVFGFQF